MHGYHGPMGPEDMWDVSHEETDSGIEMLREANAAFGNYTAPAPAVPELELDEQMTLAAYSDELKEVALRLKAEAAVARAAGQETLALLLIRVQLSVEETGEWAEALASGDIARAFQELTDMTYVTDGHYLTLGLGDLKLAGLRHVHECNMTKLGEDGKPIISEAGRWVKGPNYRKPDMQTILGAAAGRK